MPTSQQRAAGNVTNASKGAYALDDDLAATGYFAVTG